MDYLEYLSSHNIVLPKASEIGIRKIEYHKPHSKFRCFFSRLAFRTPLGKKIAYKQQEKMIECAAINYITPTEEQIDASMRRRMVGNFFRPEDMEELTNAVREYYEIENGGLDVVDYFLIDKFIYEQILTDEQKIDNDNNLLCLASKLSEEKEVEKQEKVEKATQVLKDLFTL